MKGRGVRQYLRRRWWLMSLALWAVLWAWFGSGVRTFTEPAEVLTAVPALVVLGLTVRPSAQLAGAVDAPRAPYRRFGVIGWVVVLLATVAWELTMLFSQPRHLHPTLSSILNTLLSTHPSRFLGYLLWLVLGWLLVRDLRRRPAGPHE